MNRFTIQGLLLLAFIVIGHLAASAYDFKVGDIYYNINEDGTSVSVTYKNSSPSASYTGDIVIPEKVTPDSINYYDVTGIGNSAFYRCYSLTSITMPSSLLTIGSSAFDACSTLTEIVIPENVVTINKQAFVRCKGIKTITIPNSVTTLDDYALSYTGIKEIQFGTGLTKISGGLFHGCDSLQTLDFPSGVTTIGSTACIDCVSLKHVSIPEGVTRIDSRAFQRCIRLTEIDLPSTLSFIYWDAFSYCTGLKRFNISEENSSYCSVDGVLYNKEKTTFIMFPNANSDSCIVLDGVTEIERYAFMGCSRLRYVSLPNSLKAICLAAFEDCSSLQNFIIPEGVERIEQLAFSGCSSLTEMRIPSSVSSFSLQVFYRCKSLQAIHVAEDNPILSSVDGVLYNKDKTILKAYPNHHNNDYSTYTIPEGVITVGDYAFGECTGLTKINFPNSLKKIGSCGFIDCTGLTAVVVPDSVTELGNRTFDGCKNIKNITLGRSVASMGSSIFSQCWMINITCLAPTPPSIPTINGGIGLWHTVYNSCRLYVPKGSLEAYQTTDPWMNFTHIVPVDDIGDADGDGVVTINDITAIIDFILGINSSIDPIIADINRDHKTNIDDVVALIDMLLIGKE